MITERIDNVTNIPVSHRGVHLPAPLSAKVELTGNCNYRCAFCVKTLGAPNGTMDRALYSRLIRELYLAGVRELGLFYIGESFTCPWLPEAVAEARAVGFPYVFLTTNGSLATPLRVEACFRAGLNSLKFSLNFADGDQLQQVARVSRRNFALVLENIHAARRIRDENDYPCRLYVSSIAFTGEQGERMQAVVNAVRPYVDEHYWLPLYGMSGASAAHGYRPRPGNPGRLANLRDPIPCWAVFTEAHITADGLLAACCFGTGAHDSLVMADLKQTSFTGGWNSQPFRQLRAAHLEHRLAGTACADCVAGA